LKTECLDASECTHFVLFAVCVAVAFVRAAVDRRASEARIRVPRVSVETLAHAAVIVGGAARARPAGHALAHVGAGGHAVRGLEARLGEVAFRIAGASRHAIAQAGQLVLVRAVLKRSAASQQARWHLLFR